MLVGCFVRIKIKGVYHLAQVAARSWEGDAPPGKCRARGARMRVGVAPRPARCTAARVRVHACGWCTPPPNPDKCTTRSPPGAAAALRLHLVAPTRVVKLADLSNSPSDWGAELPRLAAARVAAGLPERVTLREVAGAAWRQQVALAWCKDLPGYLATQGLPKLASDLQSATMIRHKAACMLKGTGGGGA